LGINFEATKHISAGRGAFSTFTLVDEGMENVHPKDSSKVFVEMTLGKKKTPLLLFNVLLCALIQALIYPGPYT
jgi:hypothetical protein